MYSPAAQALILAAGRGSRLHPHTEHRPKCLIHLAGQPMLQWTLDALQRCGIARSAIVSGWQADQLSQYGLQRFHNPDWSRTGTVRSLLCADAYLSAATTIMIYGDGAYSPQVIRALLDAPDCELLVPGDRLWEALWRARFDDPLSDAESWKSDQHGLLEIGSPIDSMAAVQAQFMGLLRISAPGWLRLRQDLLRWERIDGAAYLDGLDTTAMLARLLRERGRLPCLELQGGWVEIDTERDRQAIEAKLRTGDFSHEFRH